MKEELAWMIGDFTCGAYAATVAWLLIVIVASGIGG